MRRQRKVDSLLVRNLTYLSTHGPVTVTLCHRVAVTVTILSIVCLYLLSALLSCGRIHYYHNTPHCCSSDISLLKTVFNRHHHG